MENLPWAIFEGNKPTKLSQETLERLVKDRIVKFEQKEAELSKRIGQEYKPGKWKASVSAKVWDRFGYLFEEIYGKIESGAEEQAHDRKRRRLDREEKREGMSKLTGSSSNGRDLAASFNEDVDDRRDKNFWPAPEVPPPGFGMKRLGGLTMRPSPAVVSRWRSSPLRHSYSSESTPTLVDDDTDNDVTSDEHASTPENDVLAVDMASAESVPASPHVDLIDLLSDSDDDVIEIPSLPKKHSISSGLKGLGLGLKPSPLALSRRTWAPTTAFNDDPDDGMKASQSSTENVLYGSSKKRPAPDGGRRVSDGSLRGHRSSKSRKVLDEMEDLSGEEVSGVELGDNII